ncbi:MAG: MBL fold metallo-hydrolase [Syntrophobacteraceae bacterium]|nr:MBL fold metallo-hydrolase [Syntrophobacteraceae bacterium]
MKIQHIRNACMMIHYGEQSILLDPCLNPKGSLPPYAFIRKRPRWNPLVDLPPNADTALNRITAGLITHCRYGHFDHLDGSGARLLRQWQVPVYCNAPDERFLRRRRINTIPLAMNQPRDFPAGRVTAFPAKHGHGLAGLLMRPGAGYFIEPAGQKSIYISGDTVMTETVRHVLRDLRPDISIVNAGTPILDFGRPILMPVRELLDFVRLAPGMVIAVHMDAFNHCLTSRSILKKTVLEEGLADKVLIPADGELMEF